jgi:hypothetical protein
LKKLLSVELLVGDSVFATSNNIAMDTFSPSTSRTFNFKSLKLKRNINLIDFQTITIIVRVRRSKVYKEKFTILCAFSLHLLNYSMFNVKNKTIDWWVQGLPIHLPDNYSYYKQGIIDIFYCWQQNEIIEWTNLPKYLKDAYIEACMYHSDLPEKIILKDNYLIDTSLINEENDLLYYLSIELLGERGYCGWNFHTLKDCLANLRFRGNVKLDTLKFTFLNLKQPKSKEVKNILDDFKKILIKNNIYFEEK